MSNITSEHVRINDDRLIKLKIDVECGFPFTSYTFICSGVSKIAATTEGVITGNEIFINKAIQYFECFVKPKNENVDVTINFFIEKQICTSENFNFSLEIKDSVGQIDCLTIFTGKKQFEIFDERIKQKLINWNVSLSLKNGELIINSSKYKNPVLVCLGTLEKEVRSCDLSFTLDSDTNALYVPSEFLIRFSGQKIALHLLVKPDFQKKIKNIYYKSKISNEIYIEKQNQLYKRITNFSTPINKQLDPLEWILNCKTQLPEMIA